MTVWYAVSAFTLVLTATGFLYWALVTNLDREDDQFLADKVHVLRAVLRDRPADAAALRQEVEVAPAARQYVAIQVRILDEGGRLIAETPGMGETVPAEVFPDPTAVALEPGTGTEFRSVTGKSFRVLAARAGSGREGQADYILQVALDRTHEDDLLAGYRRNLWLVLGAALVVCAVGGYWIALRGIRPVEEITRTAQRIRSTTLHERIEAAGLPAELLALADTFNEMLDRLEDSFGRLSRFSADIAHELRTPINNLRGEAEVALSKPRSTEEYGAVLGSCLEECVRLSLMIDSLLFLARAENPETHIKREPLDVALELAKVREFYEAIACERGVAIHLSSADGVTADLDRTLFQRAVGNLIENALAHTPKGGIVKLAAGQQDGSLRVEVSDSGCGIAQADIPHIFDRFYRADRARSSSKGGVGLGLAIVKSIAELHGGTIRVTSEVGKGTTVVLRFPRQSLPHASVAVQT
ncbi:MAG: heavy metal sensor histidine kinase [Planctomycetes bacterium]|nr:heavy metal sensor histidine kinase [Planctomycetota bacterium]